MSAMIRPRLVDDTGPHDEARPSRSTLTTERVRRRSVPVALLAQSAFLLAQAPHRALADDPARAEAPVIEAPSGAAQSSEGANAGVALSETSSPGTGVKLSPLLMGYWKRGLGTSSAAKPEPAQATSTPPGPEATEPAAAAPSAVALAAASPAAAPPPSTRPSATPVSDTPLTGEMRELTLPTGGDKTGVSSQAIVTPQGSGKIQGMGESFSAQLSTGIATFTVPIALPRARGGAQPALALAYSSAGGHSLAGVGWSIGVPFISRQTDRGLPKYDDRASWHPEQDRFRLQWRAGACTHLYHPRHFV